MEENINNARLVLGIRVSPQLKFALTNEAENAGVSLSEYCESRLANRYTEREELERLKVDNARLTSDIAKAASENFQLAADNERLKKELSAKQVVPPAPQPPTILSDQRLLMLFEQLRGKADKVKNPYGDDFDIVYKNPGDLLTAMIYSTKTKT